MTIGELTGLYEKNYVINLKSRRNISRRLARYLAPWASLELAASTAYRYR